MLNIIKQIKLNCTCIASQEDDAQNYAEAIKFVKGKIIKVADYGDMTAEKIGGFYIINECGVNSLWKIDPKNFPHTSYEHTVYGMTVNGKLRLDMITEKRNQLTTNPSKRHKMILQVLMEAGHKLQIIKITMRYNIYEVNNATAKRNK